MRLFPIKGIRIQKVEERARDAWVDMSLRMLREGKVRFYRAKDSVTGGWLFKVCPDIEKSRTIVKALKCPPGRGFVQLEGSTMLFQKSVVSSFYYGVISLSYLDEGSRLRRKVVSDIEDVPNVLKESFEVMTYEKATGKKVPWKRLVTLCREEDEKAMITLFLIERAWPISLIPYEVVMRTSDLLGLIRGLEKAEIGEVYRMAGRLYGLNEDDVDALLNSLEEDGRIQRIEGGYVKTKG
ncbi:MAG: hypothetical protein ACE5NN_05185 [Candidatus Bathyarchaeia archaeon]